MLKFSLQLPTDLPRRLPSVLANPAAASLAAAGGVRDAVRENFISLGGRKFWKGAAEGTIARTTGADAAEVAIYQRGVALRLHGGTVRPRQARLLAIPTGDTALWPREMSGLAYIPLRRKGSGEGAPGKLRGLLTKDGRVMFLLVTHAEHRANPAVLPGGEEMREAAMGAIKKLLL